MPDYGGRRGEKSTVLLLDPTEVVGLVAFGAVAIGSAVAARRWQPGERGAALAAAAAFLLLTIEVALGTRHRVGTWMHDTIFAGADRDRHLAQAALLIAVVVIALVGIVVVRRLTPPGRARLLGLATGAAAAAMAVEGVSLHQVDSVLHAARAGGVLVIGWAWLAIACVALDALSRPDAG